jgi:hypothetical protein
MYKKNSKIFKSSVPVDAVINFNSKKLNSKIPIGSQEKYKKL